MGDDGPTAVCCELVGGEQVSYVLVGEVERCLLKPLLFGPKSESDGHDGVSRLDDGGISVGSVADVH